MAFDSNFYLYLFGGQNQVGTNQYHWDEVSVRSTQPIVNPSAPVVSISSSSTGGAVVSTGGAAPTGSTFDFYSYGTVQYEADTTVVPLVAPLAFSNGLSAPAGSFLIFGCTFGAAILPAANSNTATATANTTFVASPVSTYGAVGCANRKGTNRFEHVQHTRQHTHSHMRP